jgi:hypothetical protein
MSKAQQTAGDWRWLRESEHWQDSKPPLFPDLRPATIRIEAETLSDLDAVERKLAGFAAAAGWVERQSGTVFFDTDFKAGGFPPGDGDFDAIVGAELAGDGESLAVRVVAGGWRITRIRDREDPAGEFLSHDTEFEGVDRLPASGRDFGRKLSYRVYWRHDEEHGWRQFASRLLGFEGGKS